MLPGKPKIKVRSRIMTLTKASVDNRKLSVSAFCLNLVDSN